MENIDNIFHGSCCINDRAGNPLEAHASDFLSILFNKPASEIYHMFCYFFLALCSNLAK